MTIYEHRTSLSTTSGSTTTTTLNVRGGILRQLMVRSGTSTTVFRVAVVDTSNMLGSFTRRNWGFHTQELDEEMAMPVNGKITLNVTNASPATDTFSIYLGVEE